MKYQIGDKVRVSTFIEANVNERRTLLSNSYKGEIVVWIRSEWGVSYDVLIEDSYVLRIPEQFLIFDVVSYMREKKK